MSAKREQWGSRVGFILAAVGSAIGLGNIWRFPYVVYENGGGAFIIPYLFALLTAGIPLLILEFGAGHRYRGSAPRIFAAMKERWEWLGWWQVLVAFVIAMYYVAVVAWSIGYLILAFTQGWGQDTGGYFMNTFLQVSDSPFNLGGIRWPIFAAMIFTWFICWVVLFSGVKSGIERAGKIFMPILFVLVLVFLGKAVTLEGASNGLNWLFTPDFSALTSGKVWIAAYGQLFYSLSVGFAIMLTYSSYLSDDSDITNNAFITAFMNCGFSMLSGIMIFAILGSMAHAQGVGVNEVVSSGVGLAFVTIPQAINSLPAPTFFGVLFFLALVFAGLTSQISICEACISAVMDRFDIERKRAATIFCLIGLGVGLLFASHAGLLALDIVDHFINAFGVLTCGLVEIIMLSWFFDVESIKEHINRVSDFAVGKPWLFCLRYLTPAVLIYMAVRMLIDELANNYGGYPTDALVWFGWLPVILIACIAPFIVRRGRKQTPASGTGEGENIPQEAA